MFHGKKNQLITHHENTPVRPSITCSTKFNVAGIVEINRRYLQENKIKELAPGIFDGLTKLEFL